jgi:hypothetical protein
MLAENTKSIAVFFNGEDNRIIGLFLKIKALLVKNKNHSGARTNFS